MRNIGQKCFMQNILKRMSSFHLRRQENEKKVLRFVFFLFSSHLAHNLYLFSYMDTDTYLYSEVLGLGSVVASSLVEPSLRSEADCESDAARRRNRVRNREYALREMETMSDDTFRRMFRMSRYAFSILEQRLEDMLSEHIGGAIGERAAENSSGSFVSVRTRLAIALRFLAGGSYLDICFAFGIARGSFYVKDGILWRTMEALNELLVIGFPFHDENALQEMANGFSRFSYGAMTHCVMAIDGWVCRTRQPYLSETKYPMAFRNRKNCFGIVVLAGCDSECRFRMFSCKSSGSTNDILAWEFSDVKAALEDGALPGQYYFIGDEAFQNADQFLVPWGGRGLDPWKESFNYHLSAMRQCIERSFAILVQRWGIFWRPLKCKMSRWTLICMVAAKLHNYCIDMEEINVPPRFDKDELQGDSPTVFYNANLGPDRPGYPEGNRRRHITEELEEAGIRRWRSQT